MFSAVFSNLNDSTTLLTLRRFLSAHLHLSQSHSTVGSGKDFQRTSSPVPAKQANKLQMQHLKRLVKLKAPRSSPARTRCSTRSPAPAAAANAARGALSRSPTRPAVPPGPGFRRRPRPGSLSPPQPNREPQRRACSPRPAARQRGELGGPPEGSGGGSR